jgi:outer membrane protein assembly factor BamB
MTAAAASGANWPQFRGPAASGVGDGSPVTEWNVASGQNILWKTAIPGLGLSSPVIWGDRIFLTSAVPASGEPSLKIGIYGDVTPVRDEPAQSFKVFCLDRRTGKILWERMAASGRPKIMRHPKSTHANPTPATDGKHLIVSFGSEGLFAYDLAGAPLWKKDLGVLDAGFYTMPEAQWGFASSPIIAGDRVIIQADVQKNSFVAAFDVRTGKQLWRTPRNEVPTFCTPAVAPYTAGGAHLTQVVLNGWKHIGGYDLETGRELWKLQHGGGDIPVPTPVFAEGLVVITNFHGAGGRPIYAIRTDAVGELGDGASAIAWKQERAGNYMQTPLLYDGLAYFCYDLGVLTVYRLATGERLYQQRIGTGNAGFTSSTVAAGGRLYITNEEGRTFVVALGPEYKPIAENDFGEPVMATPAISGGVLYIRGARQLVAIGARP